MMHITLNHLVDDDKRCECQDCGWLGKASEVNPISGIEERITPGEIVPVGECPMCTALVQLIPEPNPQQEKVRKILRAWYRQSSTTDKVFDIHELDAILSELYMLT